MPGAYLTASLTLMGCYLVCWVMLPRHRSGSLLSAVLLTPFALLGAAFVPEYWQPDHVVTVVRGVGPEDFLFCFGCGGLAWMLAAAGGGVRLRGCVPSRGCALRFGAWSGGALGLALLAWSAGCGIMAAVVLGFSGCGLWMVWGPWLRLAVPGAVGFAAAYLAVGGLVTWWRPASCGFWEGRSICGLWLLGLPIEELIWACSFGGVWPVLVGHCHQRSLDWGGDRSR